MRLFGLIGFPLVQSFSKKYFEQKFKKEAINDCLFELFPLKDINDFRGLIATHEILVGLAVTIPYKEAVIPFLTELSDSAKTVRAVNCICRYGSTLVGHNTDAVGFEVSFTKLLQPQHQRALILGTGGASKAVQFVLHKLGIEFILVSRNPAQHENAIGYNEVDAHLLHSHSIVINCSPVGMVPNEQTAPDIPYHLLGKKNYLYDLVYKPAATKFLQLGAQRGAIVKNGYEMLLLQAEENWKLWNGKR